eukprot:816947-Prymnesium_polylepis.1
MVGGRLTPLTGPGLVQQLLIQFGLVRGCALGLSSKRRELSGRSYSHPPGSSDLCPTRVPRHGRTLSSRGA